MTTLQIDRAVSQATGESVREIRRRGFSLANPAEVEFDPEADVRLPLVLDWPEVERERHGSSR